MDGSLPELRRVGIVTAGGGARGAHEAGVLSVLLPELHRQGARPTVFTGTSIGSVNACLFASLAHLDPDEAVTRALAVWRRLERPAVFRKLLRTAPATIGSYVAEFAGLPRPRLTSLLDTAPLQQTGRLLDFEQLHRNVKEGLVAAVAVVATTAYSGRTVVFVQAGSDVEVPSSDGVRAIDYVGTELELPHVLASSAIPVGFPAVKVEQPENAEGWYLDGGVRLNAPIKPALALGVDHLVVIATHPAVHRPPGHPADPERPQPEVDDAAVQLLDAALADRMVEDVHTLGTINELVATGGHRSKGVRELRILPYLFVGPHRREEDIGDLAARVYLERYTGLVGALRAVRSPDFPLLRRLVGGGEGPRAGDLLSYFFFEREFIDQAIELGQRDALEALRRGELDSSEAIPWRVSAPRRPDGKQP